ncbi:MAG: TlpA family protein disulfide reductase [Clostridia bacterium]|nr:TlpA family protein disulfide reductase [Clostridia bacterium]
MTYHIYRFFSAKRLVAGALLLLLILSAVGCGTQSNPAETTASSPEVTTEGQTSGVAVTTDASDEETTAQTSESTTLLDPAVTTDQAPAVTTDPPKSEETTTLPPIVTTEPEPVVTTVPEPVVTTELTPPLPNEGKNVGELCYDYTLSVYGSNDTVRISDFRGKAVVLNFWGTWCGWCNQELVYEFPKIEAAYGDDVAVVTVHTYNEYGVDVPKWVSDHLPANDFVFCRDGAGNAFAQKMGGGVSYPLTFILDENGVITAIFPYAVSFEGELKPAIDKALAG